MIRFYLILIYFIHLSCFAQKEAHIWVYGTPQPEESPINNIGIDFNNSGFRPFNIDGLDMETYGASASICDNRSGQLLFFTNGRNVYDRRFKPMPNGHDLTGYGMQSVIIVPFPGSEHLYYIFTTVSFSATPDDQPGLKYSVVDMKLNRGFGAVVRDQKNILLKENTANKITAIPHSNGVDYWLITHESGNNRFVVLPVTTTGLKNPQFYPIGVSYGLYEANGWLKASPNGKLIACAVHSDGHKKNPLELYDFDAANGSITNRRELGLYAGLYGVSFSPDNTKLYFTDADQTRYPFGMTDRLFQIDLLAGDLESIKNSATYIPIRHDIFPGTSPATYDTLSFGIPQLAPDGKLYLNSGAPQIIRRNGQRITNYALACIQRPNLPGLQCAPITRTFSGAILPTMIGGAFPNLMQHYFNNLGENNLEDQPCDGFTLQVFPNPTPDVLTIENHANCLTYYAIELYNSKGQIIYFDEIGSAPSYSIDMHSYAAGLYMLVVKTSERILTRKIIKI